MLPPTTLRTAEFHARVKNRVDELKQTLEQMLGARTAFTLEIGCGHGHYLTALAASQPATFHLGIDLMLDRIRRAQRKRDRAKLNNLTFLRAEANETLTSLPAKIQLQDIYILFPDPWPKRRHHKNRLIQDAFLSALAQRATAESRLCFRTDHEPYFQEAAAAIREHPAWNIASHAAWPFELSTVFQQRAESYFSLVATKRR